jgi:hypothetical protein
MAGRAIEPARWTGSFPLIQSFIADAAATGIVAGSLVKTDTDGEIIECSADPATVLGVALSALSSAPGYNMANSPTTVTYRDQAVSVAVFEANVIYSMRGSTAPLLTHINEVYGVVEDADGIWYLDLAETTATIFKVLDIDTTNAVFFCKVIAGKGEFV